MTSSKSSRLRSRKSTLSLRLSTFLGEKLDLQAPPVNIVPDPPRSATSSGSSDADGHTALGDDRGDGAQRVGLSAGGGGVTSSRHSTFFEKPHLERRKSRLEIFTSFLPKLTASHTDSRSTAPFPRKPLPGNASVPDLLLTTRDPRSHRPSLSVGAPAPPLQPPPPIPSHSRKSSLPNMFRKLHKAPTEPTTPHLPSSTDIPSIPQTTTDIQGPSQVLKKARDQSRGRSLHPQSAQDRHLSPSPEPHTRSVSAQPPLLRPGTSDGPRTVSTPVNLGLHSRNSSFAGQHSRNGSDESDGTSRGRLRKSRPGSRDERGRQSDAWIMAPDSRADYHTLPLLSGEKVPELWNETANVYVYLFPKENGHGPSFKVQDQVFASSGMLMELMLGEIIARANAPETSETPAAFSPPERSDGVVESHLYLPLGNSDLERLVTARNLFAFLTGQPLVGIKSRPTIFEALLQISALLRKFGFSNYDGSSFGDEIEKAFAICMDQFQLGDVRDSREKTLEALVLGEQMRSWTLYNEGFCHAVGKYEALLALKSPLYGSISNYTRTRLERAHLRLQNRHANIKTKLEAFEFPSLFAGVAASTSDEEFKNVRFKEWKNYFGKMRTFFMGYYKDQFGSWPPKARSKKNHFSSSGLNRQCLKILYSDLCSLYDLLVNRESMTPRVIDEDPEDIGDDAVDSIIVALRKVLSEFDHSSPPVLPPIPYDVPKIPSMTTIREDYHELPAKKQAKLDKSIQQHELSLILIKSHNIDTDSLKRPFLNAFKDFEAKEAKGMAPQDWADQRMGFWLFLYVVIQTLPMMVVDAPELQFTEGVEYFLCEPPQGNLPWMEDAGEVRKMWYQTAGQGIVELSADVVMYSVEATYMRSHCWLAAKEWEQTGGMAPPPQEGEFSLELQPPPSIFQDMDPSASPVQSASGSAPSSPQVRPRNLSPGNLSPGLRASHAYRSSIAIGLEPLALDSLPGDRTSRALSSAGGSRPGTSLGMRPRSSTRDSPPPGHGRNESLGGSTFDDILKNIDQEKEKGKSKKRFGF